MNELETADGEDKRRWVTARDRDVEQVSLQVSPDHEIRKVRASREQGPEIGEKIKDLLRGQDVFDEAPIAIAIGEKDGEDHPLRYVNRAFVDMTGYEPEDILHRDCRFLQGEDTDPDRIAEISKALQTGEAVTLELRNYRKEGQMFWNRLTLAPIETRADRSQAFVAFQQDVTERRELLEMYREQVNILRDITDSMPGVSYEFRRYSDGTYTLAHLSDGFRALSGISPKEAQSHFDRVLEAVHPEDRDRLVQSVEESASTMNDWGGEFRFVHPDGDVSWVMGRSVPEERAEGLIAWRGVLIDITERKELEEKLKQEYEKTKQKSQRKTDYLASASHDLRTPLNSVLGLSSMLLEQDLSPEQKQDVKAINSAGQSMLFLVNDILDMDRIQSGKLELDPQPLELRDLLYDVMTLFRLQIKDSEITITETVTESVPNWVMADADRLQRILVNLVGNALKHTDSGRVDVRVECESRSEDQVKLRFRVSDTGPGISDEEQDQIFGSREQGSEPVPNADSGVGLGLAICQHLVRQMNGEMTVESEVGEGSTFSFTAELGVVEPEDLPDAQSAGGSVDGAKVLIVDDNSSIRNLLRRMLEDAGADVTTERSGKDAFELLKRVPDDEFDTVFIDRRMHEMSGLDVIRSLRAREEGPEPEQIYVVSGDSEQEIREQVPDGSIAGVVKKPMSESDLLEAIRTSLAARTDQTSETDDLHTSLRDRLRSKSIDLLIVDDEAEARTLLRKYMEEYADAISSADNGEDAVQFRFDQNPDLVLMDLGMEDVDGFEATRRIRSREEREDRAAVPIIIQTGRAIENGKENAVQAGADGFLTKPVSRDELFLTMVDVLD